VLAKVDALDTYVFRSRTVETEGPRPDGFIFATENATIQYFSKDYGRLSENYKNDELFMRSYTRLRESESVYVCYPTEWYDRRPLTEAQIAEMQWMDPKQIINRILSADYTELGEDTIDGKRVKGVELRDITALLDEGQEAPPLDEFVARFWIDVETELPVWVEFQAVGTGSSTRRTQIFDQFEWDPPLTASLFEPNIPAGFKLEGTDEPERAYIDSAPRNDAAEAFAADTQAEPYLSDFDDLVLPDVNGVTLLGADTSIPQEELRLRGHEDVWKTQDVFMAPWPRYEDVREQLAVELQAQLGIEQMTTEQLIGLGIALRERFWELRGCLSDVSYPYGYAARMVTAMAHDLAPDDPAVTDQYVESILTCEITSTYEKDAEKRNVNPVYPGLLTQLRVAQFVRTKADARQGYIPTWKDYVRTIDLVTLFDSYCDDQEAALEVTRWLIAQAPTAGWTYYVDTSLAQRAQAYAAGDGYRTGLFMCGPDAFPEEFRYARRLFSFQGPRRHAKGLLPMHLRHLKGW
jgi:hypothetical protein